MGEVLTAPHPRQTPGSGAGVTQTSGQRTSIPGLGGAVSDMHLGGSLSHRQDAGEVGWQG